MKKNIVTWFMAIALYLSVCLNIMFIQDAVVLDIYRAAEAELMSAAWRLLNYRHDHGSLPPDPGSFLRSGEEGARIECQVVDASHVRLTTARKKLDLYGDIFVSADVDVNRAMRNLFPIDTLQELRRKRDSEITASENAD